ncbi:hypothetical protein QE152_g39451 [Popillia japonica]|uniref:Uncharacterized protein n=1 Tax=Popillia japonica TaxID=7064 RepID=A0AAW1HTZ5_POPJA
MYKKGNYNTNADTLSRIKLNALETVSVMNNAGNDTEDLLQDILDTLSRIKLNALETVSVMNNAGNDTEDLLQDILDTENFFEVPQQIPRRRQKMKN